MPAHRALAKRFKAHSKILSAHERTSAHSDKRCAGACTWLLQACLDFRGELDERVVLPGCMIVARLSSAPRLTSIQSLYCLTVCAEIRRVLYGCFSWFVQDQVEDTSVQLSPTHRWMVVSGALYVLFGILCFTFPKISIPIYTLGTQTLEDMSDGDISMFRLCGAGLVFSGYLSAQGSRCNSVHTVSTFLFGHLVLQPLGSLALWALGARPQMCMFQAGLSVVLGLLAFASLHGLCIPWFAMGPGHSFRGNELVADGTRVRQSVP